MKKFLLTSMVVVVTALFSTFNVCQAQYGELNFVKIKPNMAESYLNDMKTSKKLANARVANKTTLSWQLFKRVYPRGSSMDYDYASLTVYPSAKEITAEGTWDSGFKELSAKEVAEFLTSVNNTRSIIATDLYEYKFGVGQRTKSGEYVQLNLVKSKPGKKDAYLKQLESFKLVMDECIKAGKLKGFSVWSRTYATNVGGDQNMSVTFTFSSLDQALSWASGKTKWSDEFKKIFPKEDYTTFTDKFGELRELISQELWEAVEVTD